MRTGAGHSEQGGRAEDSEPIKRATCSPTRTSFVLLRQDSSGEDSGRSLEPRRQSRCAHTLYIWSSFSSVSRAISSASRDAFGFSTKRNAADACMADSSLHGGG